MIARINEECNLEKCAQARANQLQQQENEMETGNSWLLKVSISSFFFSLLLYTSLQSIQVLFPGKFSLFPIGETARHRLGVCRSSKVGGNNSAL